jgi:chemotaxis protein CheX
VNVEIAGVFNGSTATVLRDYFLLDVDCTGSGTLLNMPCSLDPISVLLSFTGDLTGQFLMGFQPEQGLQMARSMLGIPDYPQFDDLCQSAISELGNMICGMTAMRLSEMGYMCQIAPPVILINDGALMSFGVPTLISQPVTTSFGEFRISIGMSQTAITAPVSR